MRENKTVVIIGGGVSGSLTAYHLVCSGAPMKIIVIEPRAGLGLGLAYSTPSRHHLLNVPAAKLSALPDEPNHFVNWLRTNYSPNSAGTDFAPRRAFGLYMQSLLRTIPRIDHRQTTALECNENDGGAVLRLAGGSRMRADAVVLATGNFDPAPLRGVAEETIANGVYCHSAWKESTYADLSPHAPVVLVGSGLTAVDVLLRLRDTGHRGRIVMISRHGILPEPHAAYKPLAEPAVAGDAPARARDLLRQVHRAIRSGADWRAVVDSLRERSNELWLALPPAEQKRFYRHLQRRWQVVRHRMAPQVAGHIHDELLAGKLVALRGKVERVLPFGEGALVRFRTADGAVEGIPANRVINCTGPDLNYRRVGSPLLNHLFARGSIVAGPHGFGLWTNGAGALRNRAGVCSGVLFHVGPGRQGTLLESIAVPELRAQAADLARRLKAQFTAREQPLTVSYELAS